MKSQIVTGLANFEKVANGEATYIDKTLFARDVFYAGSEAMLILRPRRWGKSLNLKMLEYFLEAPLKEESQRVGEIDLEKLEKKKEFFKDKKVFLEYPEMREHLGQYSVISLSLGGIQTENVDVFSILNEKISNVFQSHRNVLPFLMKDEIERFDFLLNGTASKAQLSQSLSFLSKILKRVYRRPIWILVDEYDAVVNSIWEKALKKKTGAEAFLEELVSFFGSFYESSVKGNENVYRALFTGVFRVLKGSMGTSMNNFQEYSLLDEFFDRDFGFTKEEIITTFKVLGISEDRHLEKLQEASDWYNGYHSTVGPLYNPWSILFWLKTGKVGPYWVNMGSLDIILALSQYNHYTEELSQMALGRSIEGTVLWGLVFRQTEAGSARLRNAFWTLLVFSGYMSIEKELKRFGDQIFCRLKLPNLELSEHFRYCLIDDFQNRYEIDEFEFNLLIKNFLQGDVEGFETQLKDFLRRIVNLLDVSKNKAEAFYQGFFLGLISCCERDYFIRSEFPAGKGRGDLILIPKEGKKTPAILLEYKIGQSEEELPRLAQEALDQILKRDYQAEVENHKEVTQSVSIGLSFYKKDFVLKKKEWNKEEKQKP